VLGLTDPELSSILDIQEVEEDVEEDEEEVPITDALDSRKALDACLSRSVRPRFLSYSIYRES
jgi:hypothetical protein